MRDATDKTRTRLGVERLDDRLVPSWGSVPPSALPLPAGAPPVTLTSAGDAAGTAAITSNEIDWYTFTTAGGSFAVSASTPTSWLDTVIAVYDSAGRRVAYNDDISFF